MPAGKTTAKLLRYWLPVLLMIGLMFGFSTDTFSGQNTGSVITRFIEWIGLDPDSGAALWVNLIARKAAHFVEYAILSAFLYRAFRSDSPTRWRASWAACTMAIIIAWALLDEYHQSFTASRTASVYDSLVDMAGGLFALVVIYRLSRRAHLKMAEQALRNP
jgi:VanZ family protein